MTLWDNRDRPACRTGKCCDHSSARPWPACATAAGTCETARSALCRLACPSSARRCVVLAPDRKSVVFGNIFSVRVVLRCRRFFTYIILFFLSFSFFFLFFFFFFFF